MNIHEYQAKALLKEYGVAVLRGQVAYTPEEAAEAARALGGPVYVVKAQIHAGGRGKGGGVKLAKSVEEVRQLADKILGMTLVKSEELQHATTKRWFDEMVLQVLGKGGDDEAQS